MIISSQMRTEALHYHAQKNWKCTIAQGKLNMDLNKVQAPYEINGIIRCSAHSAT